METEDQPLENYQDEGQKEFQERASLSFDEVKIGSEIKLWCRHSGPVLEIPDYEIRVIGKKGDGLQVSVKSRFPYPEEFTARMPGVFRTHTPGTPEKPTGLLPDVIKVATEEEENHPRFENPRDVRTKEKLAKFYQGPHIERILFRK